MRKISLLILCVMSAGFVEAQSYIGFLTDNYSGVNSVISNPSNIVDSRFKTDINLLGVSAFAGNDYYGVSVLDALKDDYDFDLDATKSPSRNNNFANYEDIMGPSFMFNINSKNSIAVFTRARSTININEINGNTVDEIDNNTTTSFTVDEGDFNVFSQAWAEVGLTYARVLMDNEQHFLKGGLSLKYLQGIGSAYVYGKDVVVTYEDDETSLNFGATSQGELTYGRYEEFDNDNYDYDLPEANGFGVDLGFTYEWRPNHADYTRTNSNGDSYSLKDKNKYKLKLGLSITDIGSINYKNGLEDVYDVTASQVTEDDFDNADDISDFLSTQYNLTSSNSSFKTTLPTAIHFNADWSFSDRFYVNLNTDFGIHKKGKENTSTITDIVSLTPRFESKWFSFYVPVSYVEYNGFQAGAGFRAGPLYLGSGSVISALASDNTKGADVYAGLKIPIYQGSPKDKDDDGVLDDLDACPKVPGPIENNGCPWTDRDVDGIMDNVDECPDTKGPKENNGCPWKDSDNDGIMDNVDNCVFTPGVKENKGCPWPDTDGDTVLDKDDDCIYKAGTVANNGCPEVTEEVQKALNEYARTILFNTGKSTIRDESAQVLTDIVGILQEYPSAKFSIEGHTDSTGSSKLNQNLSDSRASSVMHFLIERGVASTRLSSVGYGESKPIATNSTNTGRTLNRRVEINLVK